MHYMRKSFTHNGMLTCKGSAPTHLNCVPLILRMYYLAQTRFLPSSIKVELSFILHVRLLELWESAYSEARSMNTLILFGQAFVWDASKPKQPEEGPQQGLIL